MQGPDLTTGFFPGIFRDDVFHLETRRLWLRWPRPDDAQVLLEVAVAETAARNCSAWPEIARTLDPAAWIARARAANAAGERLDLAITGKRRPGELIGLVGLRPAVRPGTLSLGYMLRVDHQGQGLMTEAVRALVGTAFRFSPCGAIRAASAVANAASERVLLKSGFERVERPRDGAAATAPGADRQQLELGRATWQRLARPALSVVVPDTSIGEMPCGCAA
jgi:RimJ/RimL family protein N-acetyltransferase